MWIQHWNNYRQIEDYAKASNKKCAEVLFEEWGSSGRIRPTLKTLQDVVEKAQIYRAADDIAELLGSNHIIIFTSFFILFQNYILSAILIAITL